LPTPLLDGGHMVLLIYEGLRGKPASEKIVIGVSYAGLVFILTLMGFLLLLDTGLIPRI
jgi:regulator of sigma E protease